MGINGPVGASQKDLRTRNTSHKKEDTTASTKTRTPTTVVKRVLVASPRATRHDKKRGRATMMMTPSRQEKDMLSDRHRQECDRSGH